MSAEDEKGYAVARTPGGEKGWASVPTLGGDQDSDTFKLHNIQLEGPLRAPARADERNTIPVTDPRPLRAPADLASSSVRANGPGLLRARGLIGNVDDIHIDRPSPAPTVREMAGLDEDEVSTAHPARAERVLPALQSAIERVRAIEPYSSPICGDRSRGYQMGWDAARAHVLAILDGEDA